MILEVVDPFPQTSVRAEFSDLQRKQLYRSFEVDYFAHMKGTISSSSLLLSKCRRWSNGFFRALPLQGFRFVFLVSRD